MLDAGLEVPFCPFSLGAVRNVLRWLQYQVGHWASKPIGAIARFLGLFA